MPAKIRFAGSPSVISLTISTNSESKITWQRFQMARARAAECKGYDLPIGSPGEAGYLNMTLMRSVGCLSRLRPPASGLLRFLERWVIFLVVMFEPVFAVIIGRVTHD